MNIYDKNPEYTYSDDDLKEMSYYNGNASKLSDRLGIDRDITFKDTIFVSEFGTVSMKDGKGNTSEIPLDEFIRKVDVDISHGKKLVKYDKESNHFYLIEMSRDPYSFYTYNYVGHMLDVNDKSMVDYGLGNYDRTTLVLHNLCLKSADKQKLIASDENSEKFRNDIIAKAENSHEQLTPLEAKVYLDYLKDLDKQHAKTAAKEAGKITAIAGTPLAGGIVAGILKGTAIVGTAAGLGPAIGVGLIGTFLAACIEEIVYLSKNLFLGLSYDDEGDLLNGSPEIVFTNIKHAFEQLKEKIEDIKVNKVKEKYLKQMGGDKVVMPESVTVEEQPTKPLELEDNIMSEINALVDKTAFINPEDREKMLTQAKELLNTYMERSKNIINQDKSIMDPDADNMVNLRIDVCRQLAKMEMQLSAIREKDKKHDALNSEGKLLNDKIVEVGNLNSSQFDESKKEAEVAEMLSDNADDYEVLDADYEVVKLP